MLCTQSPLGEPLSLPGHTPRSPDLVSSPPTSHTPVFTPAPAPRPPGSASCTHHAPIPGLHLHSRAPHVVPLASSGRWLAEPLAPRVLLLQESSPSPVLLTGCLSPSPRLAPCGQDSGLPSPSLHEGWRVWVPRAHWLMTERLCMTPPGQGEDEPSFRVKVGSHLGGATTHLQELRSAGPCLWVLIQGCLQEISELCRPGRTDRWRQ